MSVIQRASSECLCRPGTSGRSGARSSCAPSALRHAGVRRAATCAASIQDPHSSGAQEASRRAVLGAACSLLTAPWLARPATAETELPKGRPLRRRSRMPRHRTPGAPRASLLLLAARRCLPPHAARNPSQPTFKMPRGWSKHCGHQLRPMWAARMKLRCAATRVLISSHRGYHG